MEKISVYTCLGWPEAIGLSIVGAGVIVFLWSALRLPGGKILGFGLQAK